MNQAAPLARGRYKGIQKNKQAFELRARRIDLFFSADGPVELCSVKGFAL